MMKLRNQIRKKEHEGSSSIIIFLSHWGHDLIYCHCLILWISGDHWFVHRAHQIMFFFPPKEIIQSIVFNLFLCGCKIVSWVPLRTWLWNSIRYCWLYLILILCLVLSHFHSLFFYLFWAWGIDSLVLIIFYNDIEFFFVRTGPFITRVRYLKQVHH